MQKENICPGCGRHCDLSNPHCGRGEEYLRTGKIPEQRHGKEHRCKMRMEHYQATDINDKLIINLRDLGHIMRFLYEGKASQKRILIILNELNTITQRDLTEHLGVQPGSASEILSKLENAGLIVRSQNDTDHRTTDVSLTDTGRELAAEALAQRQMRHEEMFSCITDEEKQELLLLLEKIYTDWKTRYCEDGNRGCRKHHGRDDHHGGHDHHERRSHHDDGHHDDPRRHGGN